MSCPENSQKPQTIRGEVDLKFLQLVTPVMKKDDTWKMCSDLGKEDLAFQVIKFDPLVKDDPMIPEVTDVVDAR